jgi:hypothetical protein
VDAVVAAAAADWRERERNKRMDAIKKKINNFFFSFFKGKMNIVRKERRRRKRRMNAQEKLYRWKMSYTRSRRRSRRRRGARGIRRDPAVHTRFGCVCPGRTTLAAHLFLYSSSYILIFFSYLFLKCCFKSGL